MKTLYKLTPFLILAAACSSPRTNVTEKDSHGNYVTTSDYQSMDRTEFEASIKAGLKDFDRNLVDLRTRANELGGDALKEFSDWADKLAAKRTTVVSELERGDATLADDWPDQRQRTLDAYDSLREDLDEAFEDVLEEG
jgi:hypothetical protein